MAKEPGGFDYLDSVSRDGGSKPEPNAQMRVKQKGYDDMPADGGDGFVGGNSNASTVGLDYVTGKKGSVESRPIWGEVTKDATEDSGSPEPDGNQGEDSREEGAAWANVKEADGLPRTHWGNKGAGTGDSSESSPESEPESNFGSTQKDKEGFAYLDQAAKSGKPVNIEEEAVQKVPSEDYAGDTDIDMPQTENTNAFGDGAPRWKHRG